jgi:hypothetical protein
MKLEKLLPYLSYKVKFLSPYDGVQEITSMPDFCHVSYYDNETDAGDDIHIDDIQLILYPLSHLTKEIEVDCEKFFPWDKLADTLLDEEPESFDDVNSAKQWVETYFLGTNILNLPYKLVNKLFEWHFDVNSLIEKGLAIDKTTL